MYTSLSPDDFSILTIRAMYPRNEDMFPFSRGTNKNVLEIADIIKRLSNGQIKDSNSKPKRYRKDTWETAKQIHGSVNQIECGERDCP
jgi:hypothetical protein